MNRGSTPDEIRVGAGLDHRLVVGFDGSPSAESTIEWAAREAAARAASLRVVRCCAVAPTVDDSGFSARNRQRLADAIGAIRRRHPELCIEDASTHLDPRDALLDAGSSADLLIVGGSSPGTVGRWLLGSVLRNGARRGSCPVIVVRGRRRPHLRRIVVGIDSSNAAAAALDWAIAEAECHESELLLVHAWRRPCVAGPSVRAADLDRADAQCVLDLAIRHCEKRTNLPVSGELDRRRSRCRVDGGEQPRRSASGGLPRAQRVQDTVVRLGRVVRCRTRRMPGRGDPPSRALGVIRI